MSRRIRHKRRQSRPLWVSVPGIEAFAIEPGDVFGPVSQSPHADDPAKVYVLLDAAESVLYVGATRHPQMRMRQHAADKSWWSDVDMTLWEDQPSWRQALLRESELILNLHPRYNA